MKLSLTIKERLIMFTILPKAGDFLSQEIISDIIKNVKIDKKETEVVGLENKDGNWVWDPEYNDKTKAFSFEKAEANMLKDAANTVNNKKEITQENITLIRKIKEAEK